VTREEYKQAYEQRALVASIYTGELYFPESEIVEDKGIYNFAFGEERVSVTPFPPHSTLKRRGFSLKHLKLATPEEIALNATPEEIVLHGIEL